MGDDKCVFDGGDKCYCVFLCFFWCCLCGLIYVCDYFDLVVYGGGFGF